MLKKLCIRNWKAFEEREISFGPGLNLFVGPNGSGKTTLLDAVCLGLTGDTPTGDFKGLVRDKNKDSVIELELELAGTRYFIKRRFRRDRLVAAECTADGNSLTQLGWEALNTTLARELRTDPVFFSRMIYMSEVEVFDYVKNPPSGALNTALEKVLGIDTLAAVADFTERLGKDYAKSVATLRQEIARPSGPAEEQALDESTAKVEFELNQRELETVRSDLERVRGEAQRLQLASDRLARAKSLLEAFLKGCAELGIDGGPAPLTLGRIQNLTQTASEKAKDLEDRITSLSSEKGSIESTLAYLISIQNLLVPPLQSQGVAEPPCPVCERPIDKDLATRLISKTKARIEQSQQALSNSEKALHEIRRQLQEDRASIQGLNTSSTQLAELSSIMSAAGFSLDYAQLEGLSRKISDQLRDTRTELQRLSAKSSELNEKVTAGAGIIGRAEGRAELLRIRADSKRKLVQEFKGAILAEILVSSLRELITEQRDEGIKPLYLALGDLWKRWRPEHEWAVKFDTEGRIELESKNRSLKFYQLSGGEKTVLLILSRVLMLGYCSQMDFLMIDEPLEHLDLRNRRAVLNFLVASTKCGLVKQAVVTTFEESLVRKYLDGENTNTVYLSQSTA